MPLTQVEYKPNKIKNFFKVLYHKHSMSHDTGKYLIISKYKTESHLN